MKKKIMVFVVLVSFFLIFPLSVYGQNDSKIINVIQPFDDFPDVWEFREGKIINKANKEQVSPGDPLEYQGTIINPKLEDRELSASLRIFTGGEWKEPIEKRWTIKSNSTQDIKIPFVLNDGGRNDLRILFIFDRQISGSVHPNHAFYIDDIHVRTVTDKILEQVIPWTPILQGVLVITTIALVVVTYFNMKNIGNLTKQQLEKTDQQLALTRKELESRLRAELTVSIGESNLKQNGEKWIGSVKITVRNEGNVSARHVKIHFKDPDSALTIEQLVRDEEKIKKNHFPIPGSIPSKLHYPEHILHDTTLDESRPYDLAVWVAYDYADVKNMEFIQIVKINAQSNSIGPLYEKEDIENEKKRLKKLGM